MSDMNSIGYDASHGWRAFTDDAFAFDARMSEAV